MFINYVIGCQRKLGRKYPCNVTEVLPQTQMFYSINFSIGVFATNSKFFNPFSFLFGFFCTLKGLILIIVIVLFFKRLKTFLVF